MAGGVSLDVVAMENRHTQFPGPRKFQKMKKIIHVNQHKIRSNTKTGEREPVLTCKTYKDNTYCHEIVIIVPGVGRVAKIIYSPDKPLPCGARVWIETKQDVECISK